MGKGRHVDRIIIYVYIAVMLCVFSDVVFNADYNIVASMVFVLLVLAIINIYGERKINEKSFLTVTATLLFVYQIYMMVCIYPSAGTWDPAAIMCGTRAYLFEGDQQLLQHQAYYSRYPNNLLLQFISIFLVKMDMSFGLLSGIYDGMMIVAICNCAINAMACVLVYKSARLFSNQRTALTAYLFSLLLIGMSPWSSIVYSDPFCLGTPIICYYLYAKPKASRKQSITEVATAIIIGCVCYYIKPQSLIVLIAIALFELTRVFKEPKRLIRILAGVVLGSIVLVGTQKLVDYECERNNIAIDPEAHFGAAHYLMMGLKEGDGSYSAEDVYFSGGIEQADERQKANIEESIKRVKQYGVSGLFKHVGEKMAFVYGDGTFAWGYEGGFFEYAAPMPNQKMAQIMRAFYYDNGSLYGLFNSIMQTVWLAIIFLNMIAPLAKANNEKNIVLYITLLGITLYEVLFEARARYLYIFAPIYCVLAALGADVLAGVIKAGIEKLKEKKLLREAK